MVSNCTLIGNSASDAGGGAYSGSLRNCTLTDNSSFLGGGAHSSSLNNCTLSGNSATYFGGGASYCTLNSCIVYYNSAPKGPNYDASKLNFSCTTPLPSGGRGNFTNAPLFGDTNGWSNLRLQSNSPCINAGNSAYAPSVTDLDGNPRISGGTLDYLIRNYLRPRYPTAKIGERFELSHGIERLEFRPDEVGVVMAR